MNRLAIAGLTTIVALAMTGNLFAQGGVWGSGNSPQPTDKLAKTVGLTDEQVKKIKDIEDARAKVLADARAAMKASMQTIQDATKSGDSDKQSEAFAQNQKLNDQYQEISKKFDDARMAVLTDDQKAKLKEANEAEALQAGTQMYTGAYQEQTKVCGLSDEQVKAMVAIRLAWDKAMAQWQSENADKFKTNWSAIQEAIKNADMEKYEELVAQLQELRAPVKELGSKLDADTFAVMKDDQKAKWIEHTVLQSIGFYRPCNLTEDQRSKFKQACHTLAQEKGATITSSWTKLQQEMFNSILTDDQKSSWLQLATLQYIDTQYYPAKLTDDQKAKVKANYVKLAADKGTPSPSDIKDQESMWLAAADICKKLSPQVDAMLSNEQKAAMEKMNPKQKNVSTTAPANK